jgi:hypothetical protein
MEKSKAFRASRPLEKAITRQPPRAVRLDGFGPTLEKIPAASNVPDRLAARRSGRNLQPEKTRLYQLLKVDNLTRYSPIGVDGGNRSFWLHER